MSEYTLEDFREYADNIERLGNAVRAAKTQEERAAAEQAFDDYVEEHKGDSSIPGCAMLIR